MEASFGNWVILAARYGWINRTRADFQRSAGPVRPPLARRHETSCCLGSNGSGQQAKTCQYRSGAQLALEWAQARGI